VDITIAIEVFAVLAPTVPYLLKGTEKAAKVAVGGEVTRNISIRHNWD